MARGKPCRYMELLAYHIYHLEEHTEVILWREVTPEMVAKYEAIAKRCQEDYIQKMKHPNKTFVEADKK